MTDPKLRFVNPPALPKPTGYSHVAEASGGRTIYVSGQVPLDADGNLVGSGEFRAQAHQVFRNITAALQAAGADFNSVVKLNYYVVDMTQLGTLREVRNEYINIQAPPASTTVEVRALFRPDILVEIDAIAVVAG
jgi:2-iminobutanoate/2-iminopropanoate deaminase